MQKRCGAVVVGEDVIVFLAAGSRLMGPANADLDKPSHGFVLFDSLGVGLDRLGEPPDQERPRCGNSLVLLFSAFGRVNW